jgi:DNA polymerase-3 subunit alpha
MSYRYLESFGTDATPPVTVAGHTYPDLTLVEDLDGFKALLISDLREIPVHAWTQSMANGVSMIAYFRPVDGSWFCLSTEEFLEHKIDHQESRSYHLPGTGWISVDQPRYLVYRERKEAAEKLAPGLSGEFVHLHTHTEYSALDGLSRASEVIEQAVADGQTAAAITDHGVCAGHPDFQRAADKHDVKAIFGVEAYLVDDRLWRPALPKTPTPELTSMVALSLNLKDPVALFAKGTPSAEKDGKLILEAVMAEYTKRHADEQRRARDYYHLILWAQDDVGLRNLWALTTQGNRDGFYYKPRIDWESLATHNTGIMCSTGCLRGPLAHPLRDYNNPGLATENLGRLMDIFHDRLYIELHTNSVPGGHTEATETTPEIWTPSQAQVNEWLVDAAQANDLPCIAVSDSHYPCHTDHNAHKVWMAIQTNKDLQDEADIFATDDHYHVMTRAEVASALDYLPEKVVADAISTTRDVAERCNARIAGKTSPPIFSKKAISPHNAPELLAAPTTEPARQSEDIQRLVDICLANWGKTMGKKYDQQKYMERFEYEMALLKDRHFSGYFLMWEDICRHAKSNRVLVGPGRGSGGGCLVAYLCGITEIDPVEYDLLFERFLTPGRKGLPDFDVDFPASKREMMTAYVGSTWGEDHMVRVGTHIRVKNKAIFRDLARALKSTYEFNWGDIDAITKIIDRAEASTAGKGLSWEELMDQHFNEFAGLDHDGDRIPDAPNYVERYPELFMLAERLVGRLKTYGKHAAGICISSDEAITDRLPAWVDKEGRLVAEFGMDDLEALGYVKFDLLTIRTLDTIQMAMDLIAEAGEEIDIYGWRDEYLDQAVWEDISNGHTLGMFQVETPAGTRLCKRFRPTSLSELSDVITLVRPGPMRSGLTETYFRRKTGVEPVSYAHPILETVLDKTYGVMLYQEDIMNVCRVVAGYTLEEADTVRKMLGKKQTELAEAAAEEFAQRAAAFGVVTYEVARVLGDQMIEFSKYSFNRSHAFAYGMVGYWTAWLKHHYPVQFLTAALSTVDKERIPDFIQEARRLQIRILPPDINGSGEGFRGVPQDSTIRYGLDAILGVGEKALKACIAGQPYADFDDFMARKDKAAHNGVVATLAKVGVFDTLVPNRAGLLERLQWETDGSADVCANYSADYVQSATNGKETWTLPCTFDWASEPVALGKSGRPLKAKPPAKKCTKACRNYQAPEPPDFSQATSLTADQIRAVEQEVLGTYLSSTPFDAPREAYGAEFDEIFRKADELEIALPGSYVVIATVSQIKHHNDRNNNEMAFLRAFAQNGDIDVTVFASTWGRIKDMCRVGSLIVAKIRKQPSDQSDRGYVVEDVSVV